MTPREHILKTEDNGQETVMSCKNWKAKDMIECINDIVRKETYEFECQLPVSLRIGNYL